MVSNSKDITRALVANCLIALSKCPGVLLIGVSEIVHMQDHGEGCMALMLLQSVALTKCVGLQTRNEGDIHRMNDLFSTHQDQTMGLGSLNQATIML